MNYLIKISENQYKLIDHGGGFDQNLCNMYLDTVIDNQLGSNQPLITTEYILSGVNKRYDNIKFKFNSSFKKKLFGSFESYYTHPKVEFNNFICSFNGAPHISRKLLVSAIEKFGWFNKTTCSKNFSYAVEILDGHLLDFLDQDDHRVFRKFFIGENSRNFFENTNSFGHVRFDHKNNIYNLENKITSSFLHIVSETMATSYYPFVTEKFLYSIVTRGLFLSYAQPQWHDHVEKYYGFKKYDKIFNYQFDNIKNPVKRLIELCSMISKFSILSTDDWRDLYELEIDTIEYNYEHYFSKNYLKHLKNSIDCREE